MNVKELRSGPMLRALTENEWAYFLDCARLSIRSYSKGQVIYLEGTPCHSADFIASGALFVKRHDLEGRTFMIDRFKAGDMIGANLLFSSDPIYPMTVIAESDCSIIQLDKEILIKWCQENDAFLKAYLNEISDKTKVLVKAVKKISTGTLRENLITYFDELREKDLKQSEDTKSYVVVLPMTKKELSERFGVARTSLSRELRRMEEDKLIQVLEDRKVKVYLT